VRGFFDMRKKKESIQCDCAEIQKKVAMKVNGKQDPDGIRLYRILILSK
jgi:hypothetical protein